jgi:hypothetical protein
MAGFAIAVNIRSLVTVCADHAFFYMDIKVAFLSAHLESQTFSTMAGQTSVHIISLAYAEETCLPYFLSVACVTCLDVATLTVKLLIRDIGYIHEAALLFIPISHSFSCMMQAL